MLRSFCLLSVLVLLPACLAPREQCIANANRDLTALRTLIAEAERNISRGYASKQVVVSRPTLSFCVEAGGRKTPCFDTIQELQTRPEAIDLNAERQKLASMRTKERELAGKAQRDISACQATHPAGQ